MKLFSRWRPVRRTGTAFRKPRRARWRPALEPLERRDLLSTVTGAEASDRCSAADNVEAPPSQLAPVILPVPRPDDYTHVGPALPIDEQTEFDLGQAGRFLADSPRTGTLIRDNGLRERFVEVELVDDPNRMVCYPPGLGPPILSSTVSAAANLSADEQRCVSTLIGFAHPRGKQSIGGFRVDPEVVEDGITSFGIRILFGVPARQNASEPLDANGSGQVTLNDALHVINFLNSGRLDAPALARGEVPALDTSGDGHISPIDALLVMNRLERHSGR